MTAPSLASLIDECSDVELAAIFEHIWEARGYETRVRFKGPNVLVEAEGKTPDGTPRELRIWITSSKRITADMTSAFVRNCDFAGFEPYLAVVGRGSMNPDAYQTGLVKHDASGIAVEVRETGTEEFVRGLVGEKEPIARNWLGDPTDPGEEGGDKSDGEGGEGGEDPDGVSRRAALKKVGQYVVGGFVTYVVVEQISDFVQSSPKLRAEVEAGREWVDSHLPDVSLPAVEWEVPTPQPLYDEHGNPNTEPKPSDEPTTTATIPYGELASNPEGYAGDVVTYTGRVDSTREDESVRLATVTVADEGGRLTGDVVTRWPTGRFFDDAVGFRLLENDEIRFWGTVAGSMSLSGGPTVPLIDVQALEKA
ncbi:hypothetical protein ACFQJC_03375 [Haloferax namakaokahaiae]|uniref:Restriction endonuclease n=1 Tax=Haloferax namakaokahaiae TaxID=1748331 RepID=A0ABD5ZBV6_9EURY